MLDAVLPLTSGDLPRAHILAASLRRHFDGLGRLFVVTPHSERRAIEWELPRLAFPGRPVVLSETELVPELAHAALMRGWYRQQLLKLAIAERVRGANYLTLDADVICVRDVRPSDLAPSGRGLCHVLGEDEHWRWYRDSAAVLGLSPGPRGRLHNLTPAILCRQAVLELQAHLAERALVGQYRSGPRGLRQRAVVWAARTRGVDPLQLWRAYLIGGTPWTEYALYYTWLEHSGRLAHYHSLSTSCIYSVENSVWSAPGKRFEQWDPAPLFQGQGPPYFAVVQSIARVPVRRVWAKLAPYLDTRAA